LNALTYDTAVEFKIDPTTAALNGGEDYELLFTIKPSDFELLKNHPDIHFIGHTHDNANQNVMISKIGTSYRSRHRVGRIFDFAFWLPIEFKADLITFDRLLYSICCALRIKLLLGFTSGAFLLHHYLKMLTLRPKASSTP